MDDCTDFIIAIAREAGTFLRARLNDKHVINYKGEINIVTEEDRISEEMITARIRERYPDHDILAEESTRMPRGSKCR